MIELPNANDWIVRNTDSNSLERIEAFFTDHAYESHRHDTFAIGQTLTGVQSFHYRGEMKHSLPGMTMVLHPDEKHDGEAGSQDGFRYRMMYVEPATLQEIMKGKPLPFFENGLSQDSRLFKATDVLLQGIDQHIDVLENQDALYDLATALYEISDKKQRISHSYDYVAAERAREFIHASLFENISLDDIEKNVGRDRWSLSRDFRLLFGTSPHRYMTMRRLEVVKSCLMYGESLTQASLIAGFFDQSHMTRHFLKTFGLTPARWRMINKLSS